MNWDDYYTLMAQAAALKSKDDREKVGCVVVGPSGNLLTSGFNGFPRGVLDTAERLRDKRTKLMFIAHAERNALDQAARHGISLYGASLYVTKHPCGECAKSIIQTGIVRVVCPPCPPESTWRASADIAATMFSEAGVALCIRTPSLNLQLTL